MPRSREHITDAQLDAVRLILSGYTSAQAARRLHTTEQGIHLRIKAAMQTLGALTRPHLAVIVLHRGLVHFDEIDFPQEIGFQHIHAVEDTA